MDRFARAMLLVAAATLACASAAAAGGSATERVRLVDPAPVTLRGVDFRPYERVSISVSLGSTDVRRVLRAGPAGGFLTVFPALRYDRCRGALAVTALGNRGSRAAWKLVPLECPDRTDS